MLRKIEAIGRGLSVLNPFNRQWEEERVVGERTREFLDFMSKAEINVDELSPEVIAEWLGHLKKARLAVTEQSLDLTAAFSSSFLWFDTQIKFKRSTGDGGEKQLVVRVKQNAVTSGSGWGNIPLNFSGVLTGLSLIRSGEDQNGVPFISFREKKSLGFELLPQVGGVIVNFVGDQPHA